jgi:hypothetical protein
MEIGIGLWFRVFIASFHARFNELFYVSIVLALVAAFLIFDPTGLVRSHEANLREMRVQLRITRVQIKGVCGS